MRIAVFIKATTFHKGHGGLETQNKALCEGLVRRNHEITVFSPQKDLTKTEAFEGGVSYVFVPSVYRLGIASSRDKNNWLNRSSAVFSEMHQKSKFDLVLSQSSAGLGVIKNKNHFNIKVISISHGTIVSEFNSAVRDLKKPKEIAKLMLDSVHVLRNFFGRQRGFVYGSDKVIAVSNYVKKALIDETFVADDFVEVINNGVDPSIFENLSKTQSSKIRLIYIGRILKIKGIFNLISVLEKMKNETLQLDIVGGGEDFDELAGFIKKKSLPNVHLHGNLAYAEAMAKLFDSDILVMPTLRIEGFPMVLAEAMFCSLPIVATNTGGTSDGVIDGKTGYLVAPGNLADLQDKITTLVNNADLRKEMGQNGKIYAQSNFSIDIMLDKYEKVFKEVLKA